MWAAVGFKRNEADYSKPSTRIWLVSTDKLGNKHWLKRFMISINKSVGFILVESSYVCKQISINYVAGQGCNIYILYFRSKPVFYISTHEPEKKSTTHHHPVNIITDLMPMKSLRYMRTLFISLPNSDIMTPAATSTSYSVQESLTNKATMAGLEDTCYY